MNGMEQQGGSQWYIGTPNGIVLCIEQRRGSELAGRFYHRYSAEPTAFSDLGQMTLLMEKLYDDLQFPFAGTNERRFSDSGTAPRMRQEKEERMSTGRTAAGRDALPGWRRTRPSASAPCGR